MISGTMKLAVALPDATDEPVQPLEEYRKILSQRLRSE